MINTQRVKNQLREVSSSITRIQMLAIAEPTNKELFYDYLQDAIERMNLISNVYYLSDKDREKLLEEYPGYHESFLMYHKDFLTSDHIRIGDFNGVKDHIYDKEGNIEFHNRGKEKSNLSVIDKNQYRMGENTLNTDRLRFLLDDFLGHMHRLKNILNLMYCVPYNLPNHIGVNDGHKTAQELLEISDEYKEYILQSEIRISVTKLNFISHFAYISHNDEDIYLRNHENTNHDDLFVFYNDYSIFALEYSEFGGINSLQKVNF